MYYSIRKDITNKYKQFSETILYKKKVFQEKH